MSQQALFAAIDQAINAATGQPFQTRNTSAVGGGCINTAYRLQGEGLSYFVKLNRANLLAMFEAEAEGLESIAATQTIRVPTPICTGTACGQAYLVMENLQLGGGKGSSDRLLGQHLAALHRIKQAYFGWHRDNTIGSTPQTNQRYENWGRFWAEQRLGYQLRLAQTQGYGGRLQQQGEKLKEALPRLFSDHQPQPSLLHGDLWGGNYAVTAGGLPVIFDPACYFGDREADLAMTELFGGFSRDFYAAYREAYPLDTGYQTRKTLYNLYHILNHLNLFGGGYLGQAESMIAQLLAELR